MNCRSRFLNKAFVRPLLCLTGVAAVPVTPVAASSGTGGQATVAPTPATCTAQWLQRRQQLPPDQRYNRKLADDFGRKCLGITGRVPIDWAEVERELAGMVTAGHALTSIVPADIGTFCPRYRELGGAERSVFWRTFIVAVIKPEAGTNQHAIMWEQPRKNGQPVGGEYSIGLLQLSISNARPYSCDVPTEASLLELKRNLDCGLKILTKLVNRDSRIGGDLAHGRLGAARYWSTVRVIAAKPKPGGARETRKPIIAATTRLPPCRGA